MSDSSPGSPDEARGEHLPELHREVLRPTSDRGRLAALATICSLAGVALGFALAGTMFASIPVAARLGHSSCTAQRLQATPAWIGVGVRSDGPSRGLPAGAWVRTVRPGSPAAKESSIRIDDVIVAVDEVRISCNDDLVHAIRSRAPGTRVRITVARGHERVTEAMFLEPMPPEIWRVEQRNAARQR